LVEHIENVPADRVLTLEEGKSATPITAGSSTRK